MPGALGPVDLVAPAQIPPLPSYARLLARGQALTFAADSLEQALFRLFGISGDELPVAPLTYALEKGSAPEGWCMRADPVFMVPGQTSLMLMAEGGDLRLTLPEAQAMVDTLNRHFEELALRFEAPTPMHWYVFGQLERVETTPLSRVRGRSVTGRLPQGPDGVQWNGILAELQMLLHDHEVNRRRVASGLPQVNSVWFWGGGHPPQLANGGWRQVWSDQSLPMALAQAAGSARADRPADGHEWLARAEPGHHLLVLDDLEAYLPDISQDAWCETMTALERDWWEPLFLALRRGALEALDLYPLDGRVYRVDRRSVRRWWRRPRPWSSLLEQADYGQTD
jgi:hypothetical protein